MEWHPPGATKDWDWYPGALLAQEAGAVVVAEPDGTPWRIVAHSRRLAEKITAVLLD